MEYALWWLTLAVPCFFYNYCSGAYESSRLSSPSFDDSFWKFYTNFFREGFHLLIHDYFGVYCPWSWKRAKRYRLADMRIKLGERGRHHDRLGHITATDCDNPKMQEAIARYTYISRTKQWLGGTIRFFFAPIIIIIFIILVLLDIPAWIQDTVRNLRQR